MQKTVWKKERSRSAPELWLKILVLRGFYTTPPIELEGAKKNLDLSK